MLSYSPLVGGNRTRNWSDGVPSFIFARDMCITEVDELVDMCLEDLPALNQEVVLADIVSIQITAQSKSLFFE